MTTLNNAGYEIAGEGASGKIAMALARTALPDVILMAVGLSDMDGIETSHDVMRTHPVPIVLITSHYDAATIERAKRHWGRDHGFFKSANNLTISARDPISRQPELKACAVRVRKVTVFPVEDN